MALRVRLNNGDEDAFEAVPMWEYWGHVPDEVKYWTAVDFTFDTTPSDGLRVIRNVYGWDTDDYEFGVTRHTRVLRETEPVAHYRAEQWSSIRKD